MMFKPFAIKDYIMNHTKSHREGYHKSFPSSKLLPAEHFLVSSKLLPHQKCLTANILEEENPLWYSS